ncbi:MAG: T9SS type A sorting domain-containing protein [Chitinophagales bacterium]|jgi:hypothetical protein
MKIKFIALLTFYLSFNSYWAQISSLSLDLTKINGNYKSRPKPLKFSDSILVLDSIYYNKYDSLSYIPYRFQYDSNYNLLKMEQGNSGMDNFKISSFQYGRNGLAKIYTITTYASISIIDSSRTDLNYDTMGRVKQILNYSKQNSGSWVTEWSETFTYNGLETTTLVGARISNVFYSSHFLYKELKDTINSIHTIKMFIRNNGSWELHHEWKKYFNHSRLDSILNVSIQSNPSIEFLYKFKYENNNLTKTFYRTWDTDPSKTFDYLQSTNFYDSRYLSKYLIAYYLFNQDLYQDQHYSINVLDSTSYFDSIRNINVYDKYFYSKRKWINDSIDKIDTVVSKNTINNLSLQLMLHPNPASDYVEVVSQKWTVGSVVEMYNLLGQQVFPSIEMSNDGLRLDVRDLSEGIYLLQMRDKSGSVIKTEKLVISR